MVRSRDDVLLLGEWACLGVIASGRTHGFDVARRLAPDGDLGRVWSLSRALTYRGIDQLADRGYIEPVSVEPGRAGGTRTVYGITRAGRSRLRGWLTTPVEHLRDLRSELLLKLLVADDVGVDVSRMLHHQREIVVRISASLQSSREADDDLVTRWRLESSMAALRFLDSLIDGVPPRP